MKRRSTLINTLLAASMLAGTAATAAEIEGPKVFWKISMWGNPRALSADMEEMAKNAAEATDGNFQIKIFYGGQLSGARENLDGLKLNAFEGAAICNFYHPGKNPAWMVFSLPFLPLGDLTISWNAGVGQPLQRAAVVYIPEPTTMALAALGLCGVLATRRPRVA